MHSVHSQVVHFLSVRVRKVVRVEVCVRAAGSLHLGGVEARQLVRLDHRQHLAEALAHASDALRRVAKRHLAPGHELDLLAVQISQVFLAARTREALLAEHGVFIAGSFTLRHEQIV